MNVVLNSIQAIKSAARKDGRLRVSLSQSSGGAEAVVRIEDNGGGISPEVQERIFDPFFSTKNWGGGTGLGLFIVDRLVDAHGGRVTIESEQGSGTTFIITLPAAEVDA